MKSQDISEKETKDAAVLSLSSEPSNIINQRRGQREGSDGIGEGKKAQGVAVEDDEIYVEPLGIHISPPHCTMYFFFTYYFESISCIACECILLFILAS